MTAVAPSGAEVGITYDEGCKPESPMRSQLAGDSPKEHQLSGTPTGVHLDAASANTTSGWVQHRMLQVCK